MKKGFTLIELLIVIIILGVLAALITGNFITSLEKGRDAQRKSDLESLQRALELYYEDNSAYPTSNFLATGTLSNGTKVYMERTPSDPSQGQSYLYQFAADGSSYQLYACLENDQQILPYTSVNVPGNFTCNTQCFDKSNNKVKCVWGISSGNTTP